MRNFICIVLLRSANLESDRTIQVFCPEQTINDRTTHQIQNPISYNKILHTAYIDHFYIYLFISSFTSLIAGLHETLVALNEFRIWCFPTQLSNVHIQMQQSEGSTNSIFPIFRQQPCYSPSMVNPILARFNTITTG